MVLLVSRICVIGSPATSTELPFGCVFELSVEFVMSALVDFLSYAFRLRAFRAMQPRGRACTPQILSLASELPWTAPGNSVQPKKMDHTRFHPFDGRREAIISEFQEVVDAQSPARAVPVAYLLGRWRTLCPFRGRFQLFSRRNAGRARSCAVPAFARRGDP